MFDPASPEGAVEQVALADLAAFVVCLEQLPKCDVDALTRYSALEYAAGNVRLASEWNEAGYKARGLDDYNYRVDGIAEFSEDGTEAVILLCLWGGTQLYAPATDTTPEVIIDGEYESSKERVLVRRLGDSWFVTASDFDETVVGETNNLCL